MNYSNFEEQNALFVELEDNIADEATANLDVETGKRTVAILHSVCKNGTAVILSTHNEALIQDFPGIVYCCHDGTIDECTDNYRIK